MRIGGKAACLSIILALLSGCATIDRSEPTAGLKPAEIEATQSDEFLWRGRNYSVDRMTDALRTAKSAEGITSVILLYGEEATVQDIVDVALVARGAGLPAFYRQGEKLNHITVSR